MRWKSCLFVMSMLTVPQVLYAQSGAFSLQSQIDAVGLGGTVRIPKGHYYLKQPLNCRNKLGLQLIGEGAMSVLVQQFPPELEKTPAIDLTGSSYCSLRDFRMVSDVKTPGYAGILFARNSKGESSGWHNISNVVVEGYWRLACVMCIASEINDWRACHFWNKQPGGHDLILTDRPSFPVSSPFGPIGSSEDNNTVNLFSVCHFGVYGYSGVECNVIAQNTSDLTFLQCSFSNSTGGNDPGKPTGQACIRIDRLKETSFNSDITIQNCHCETWGAKHFLYVTGATNSVMLLNNSILSAESAICATSPCEDWFIRGGRMESTAGYDWGDGGTRPLMKFVELTGSEIHQNYRWCRLDREVPPSERKGRRFATVAVQVTGRCADNVFRVKQPGDVKGACAAGKP